MLMYQKLGALRYLYNTLYNISCLHSQLLDEIKADRQQKVTMNPSVDMVTFKWWDGTWLNRSFVGGAAVTQWEKPTVGPGRASLNEKQSGGDTDDARGVWSEPLFVCLFKVGL